MYMIYDDDLKKWQKTVQRVKEADDGRYLKEKNGEEEVVEMKWEKVEYITNSWSIPREWRQSSCWQHRSS